MSDLFPDSSTGVADPNYQNGLDNSSGWKDPVNNWYNFNDQGATPSGVGGDPNGHVDNDTFTAMFGGNANAPHDVYFGGVPQGAALASQYYTNLANKTGQNAAPQMTGAGNLAARNMSAFGMAAYNGAHDNSNAATAQQNQALGYLGQAAAGNGPSAAQSQLQSGLEQGINANMAMANSTRGQAGLANAQKGALQQNAQMAGQNAQQAAQLRAQEMQQAQSSYAQAANQAQNQYGQQALGYMGQNWQAPGILSQNDQAQAGLQAGQNSLNQQGSMGYQQMSFNAQMAAMQAQQQNQQLQYQLNMHNADNAQKAGDKVTDMMSMGMKLA